MKYSSFNWAARGKRGWIFGPFFGRTLTVTLEHKRFVRVPVVKHDGRVYGLTDNGVYNIGTDRRDGHQA